MIKMREREKNRKGERKKMKGRTQVGSLLLHPVINSLRTDTHSLVLFPSLSVPVSFFLSLFLPNFLPLLSVQRFRERERERRKKELCVWLSLSLIMFTTHLFFSLTLPHSLVHSISPSLSLSLLVI